MTNLEDVFVTEGAPNTTFVKPSNYSDLLIDIRTKGKPVIIDGQSGTGKTTTVLKILEELYPDTAPPKILTPRNPNDIQKIREFSLDSSGTFIIDDFHRLDVEDRIKIADLAKFIAEMEKNENTPKIVIIGINDVGVGLIKIVPDIAKRLGIHRILPGTESSIVDLINKGCKALNIKIIFPEKIANISRGDYWLTQKLCKTICS